MRGRRVDCVVSMVFISPVLQSDMSLFIRNQERGNRKLVHLLVWEEAVLRISKYMCAPFVTAYHRQFTTLSPHIFFLVLVLGYVWCHSLTQDSRSFRINADVGLLPK